MKKIVRFALIFATILLFGACQPDPVKENTFTLTSDINANVANAWFTLTLKLAKETPGFTAPVAARAFAYTGLTLYESVVGGMPEYHSLQGNINNFLPDSAPEPANSTEYHWGVCANRALAYITSNLFKNASVENLAKIKNLEAEYEAEFSKTISQSVFDRSKNYGETVAVGVYKYAKSDGQDEAYSHNYPSTYNVSSFQGSWIPTPPTYQTIPSQPYWGKVRTFMDANANNIVVPAPQSYSTAASSIFHSQANEIYVLNLNLTQEQKSNADYWNDEPGLTATPAGHAIAILKQVLETEHSNLAVAAESYSKLAMGLHDAFVSCWKTKYQYSLMRPVTYIRAQIDPSFKPYLTTPPYPEYTSVHSVQMATMAQILSDLFGEKYAFSDKANLSRTDINGAPRTYATFFKAAEECAFSSMYGGQHFRDACEKGMAQGIAVGKNVATMQYRK
jgi:hypothetical protein